MAMARFSHSMTPNSDLTKSRPKYTTTSGFTTMTVLTHFSNKNKFHGISDHCGHFWKYFQFINCTPGPRFRFYAPGVLTESISSRLCAIRRQYEAEYGNKERSEDAKGQPGSRNMAAIRFSDSATTTFDLSKSRPKYTTTSDFEKTLKTYEVLETTCSIWRE